MDNKLPLKHELTVLQKKILDKIHRDELALCLFFEETNGDHAVIDYCKKFEIDVAKIYRKHTGDGIVAHLFPFLLTEDEFEAAKCTPAYSNWQAGELIPDDPIEEEFDEEMFDELCPQNFIRDFYFDSNLRKDERNQSYQNNNTLWFDDDDIDEDDLPNLSWLGDDFEKSRKAYFDEKHGREVQHTSDDEMVEADEVGEAVPECGEPGERTGGSSNFDFEIVPMDIEGVGTRMRTKRKREMISALEELEATGKLCLPDEYIPASKKRHYVIAKTKRMQEEFENAFRRHLIFERIVKVKRQRSIAYSAVGSAHVIEIFEKIVARSSLGVASSDWWHEIDPGFDASGDGSYPKR